MISYTGSLGLAAAHAVFVAGLLLGCGDEPPAAAGSSGSASAPSANGAPPAAAEAPSAAVAPAGATLPAPVAPAAWSTTMDELTVDGTTVRDVSATCGMFAMMPVVQVIAGATVGCADRSGVTVAATFEGGRATALQVTGAGADCVRAAVQQATTSAACQFQITFGD
jgi:hypothetical protein